jgi:hypothetical protein
MNQPRRSAARSTANIAAFDDQDLNAGKRGLTRDRGTIDPGADDDQLVRGLSRGHSQEFGRMTLERDIGTRELGRHSPPTSSKAASM